MLTVIFGSDTPKARTRALGIAEEIVAAGATLHRIEAEQYAPGILADALGATSLFGDRSVYLFDTPSDNPEYQAELRTFIADLQQSTDQYIVIEKQLLAADRKPFEKAGAVIEEYQASPEQRFNVFALADALARKDKKSLWLLWCQARNANVPAEEIIGTLWWQLKSIRLAALTSSAAEAGMKDFPYQKAKRAVQNFAPGELERLSLSLITLYHQGHGGEVDIDVALEQWALKM